MSPLPTLRMAAFGTAAAIAGLLQAQTARLQIIHNCADLNAAAVDVYVNGGIVFDDFAFRTATGFFDIPAGVTWRWRSLLVPAASVNDALFTQTINWPQARPTSPLRAAHSV
ncbi:MAG: DUF4397 domain-containing protein [Flavobacteriales bacterium]|nr:DUF4397 domain-containing protein [Flavobacteriales bacterium]